MDKLQQLRTALDEILDDDHVAARGDGSYEVRQPDGHEAMRVRQLESGDWTLFFESGHPVPHAPRHHRANEVVAWALQ